MLNNILDAGYAFVNSDLRGRGSSEGEWKPENNFTVEGKDGYDSVEWIASQDWCDGNVGMIGASHAAYFQWLTALEKPPHLKAIAPWTGDFNEMFVPPLTGGAISLITALLWLPREAADVVNRLERQGQDVNDMRLTLNRALNNLDEFYNFLPLKDMPIAQFERLKELWNWRLNPVSQPELEKHRIYEEIAVPCFHQCGWYDGAGWAVIENFCNMKDRAGSKYAQDSQHLVVGPWPHAMQFQNNLGDLNFGAMADSFGSGIHEFQIAFFDRYLRGKDVKIPIVKYFVMGKNSWQTANSWPLPQTRWQRYYLHSKGNANTSSGDGLLSCDAPGVEPPDMFIYNPHHPVPTVGGPLIGAITSAGMVAGPIEQSYIEKRHDVLCYTTSELKEDIEVTGPLQLHLFASTSARDTDFSVKLVHVYPDGRAYNLAEGIIRASGRSFRHEKELVNPGQIYEFVITLGQTSQHFRKGHRIRINISSSNFPQFDRNMNTGNAIGEDAYGIPAIQTIYHQHEYASYIDLPIIP
jgi:putative CocE/NonD family hydrolase